MTHLGAAALKGDKHIVEMLIAVGGVECVNLKDKLGRDALAMAVLGQHDDV